MSVLETHLSYALCGYGCFAASGYFLLFKLVKMRSNQNEVKSFNFDNSEIRTVVLNDQPYFVGKDVCDSLGIKSHRDSLKALDSDERRESEIPTPGGKQNLVVVNESGLYHLIFRSNKPEARRFRKWVTSEVLPALRKNGHYGVLVYQEPTGQTSLFPVESREKLELQQLAMDVALGAKPGSRVSRLVRMLKPYLFTTSKSLQL